jgi:hypothetical protein
MAAKVFRIEDRDERTLIQEGIIGAGDLFYAQYNDQIVGTVFTKGERIMK